MIIDYQSLRTALAEAPKRTGPVPPDCEEDAVCLLLLDRDDTRLLAIQKADNEGYRWRDQIALPGGRIDPADVNAEDAALRELHEELNIERSGVEVLGNLGHYRTAALKNDLEVIVGRWKNPSVLHPDRREIQRVLELNLADVIELHTRQGFRTAPASAIGDDLVYPLSGVDIWGVTARILNEFLELVLNNDVVRESK